MAAVITGSRRDALLAAAASLFRERGYFGVGIHEIGNAAGIVGSGVYRHFASKEAILVALTDTTVDGLIAGARAARAEAAPGWPTLDRLVRFHLAYALDQRDLIAVYLGEERNLGETDRRRLRRKQRAYVTEWADALDDVRRELDPAERHLVAQAAISLLHTVAYHRPPLPRDQVESHLHTAAMAALGKRSR